jgi:hypothetical protein
MSMTPTITMTGNPDAHIRSTILGPLLRFNESRMGAPDGHQLLAAVISDPGTGAILGGLWGETLYSQLHIDLLFVRRRCAAPASATG